jgi:hypothetical protein
MRAIAAASAGVAGRAFIVIPSEAKDLFREILRRLRGSG